MFDGSFKAKRTINLGGNKQQVDKQKLLRQAQEERRLREAERLRLKSAERIQVLCSLGTHVWIEKKAPR
jgi:hypothetical protein